MTTTDLRFGYAETAFGQIHYATAGTGPPLLCLHQTPRSWDEFRELIPLLAPRRRVIAMDTLGMGRSAPPPGEATIEAYADGAAALIEVLDLEGVAVLGHHTGGVIALDLTARHGDAIDRLVLSSTPWVDAAARERRQDRPPVDRVDPSDDGTHLAALWQRRQGFYPKDRPDVLERFVHDAIEARDPEEGHLAVGRYRMEDVIEQIRVPTLCIGAADDPFAFPELEPLSSRIDGAVTAVVAGGTVGLMEDKAAEVAAIVVDFLP